LCSASISTATARQSFRHACALGLEGIVSKRRDASYRSGRSPDWTGRDAHHRVDVTKLLESFVLVPNDERAFDICVREGDGMRYLGSRPTVEECERAVESWTKSTYVKSSIR
jgi:ATP-dependent DNA ligase